MTQSHNGRLLDTLRPRITGTAEQNGVLGIFIGSHRSRLNMEQAF
jgi:hypothetical protein